MYPQRPRYDRREGGFDHPTGGRGRITGYKNQGGPAAAAATSAGPAASGGAALQLGKIVAEHHRVHGTEIRIEVAIR